MSEEEKKKLHPLQRAWAGGVMDSRAIFPKNTNVCRIETTDEVMIRRFQETVGLGNIHTIHKQNMARPMFIFQTEAMDQTRELCLLAAPFLSALKAKQAAEVVARIERNPYWRKKNPEKAKKLITVAEATDEGS